MSDNAARLRLMLGAFCISFSAVFVRLTSVEPTVSAFYRVLIGGCVLVSFMLIRRQRVSFSRGALIALSIASVSFAADLWFWHRSIQYVGPGLSTLLAAFQVFFVTAAGVVFLGQSASPRQLAAIPLALFGLALIVGIDWQARSPDYRLGVVCGLLTALCYAVYLLSLRRAQQGSARTIPVPEVAFVSVATALILGLTTAVEGVSLAIPTLADAAWLVCLGVLAHVVGWLFITSGLPHVTPAVFGIALLLQPTLSLIWDVLFFERSVSTVEAAGAALTLIAIFLGTTRSRGELTGRSSANP